MFTDSDSDGAPEELTFEQGNKQEQEISVAQIENKTRVAQEKKEKRRLWAQRRKQRETTNAVTQTSKKQKDSAIDPGLNEEPNAAISGMLPRDIVSFLATREKQIFTSDSEKETIENDAVAARKKKKHNPDSTNAVLLKDLPPCACTQNALDFLKRRKEQVARSQAVLKNANQTLRFLSSPGNLLSRNSPAALNWG